MKTFNRKIVVISLFAIAFGFSSCMPSATQIMRHPNFTWVKDSSNRFYIHMEKSIWTQKRMDSIKLAMENNFAFVMQKLQNDFFPYDRIHHFIVENPNSIKTLIDFNTLIASDIGYGFNRKEYFPKQDSLGIQLHYHERYLITTFNQNSSYSREKDLLSIIIINSIWGACSGDIDQSIGIYINDSWKDYSLHDLAAYLYKNSYRIGLNQLFSFNPQSVQYPMMASLVKYAAENYGLQLVQEQCKHPSLWTSGLQGKIIPEWETMLKERYSKPSPIDTIRYLYYYY